MSKTDNLKILQGLYAEAQAKLRAMRLLIASELDLPVGKVQIEMAVGSGYESIMLTSDVVTSVIGRSLDLDSIDELLTRWRTGIVVSREEVGDD
jgi:hypothetical protein